MAQRQSVDLHNRTVSLECLQLSEWEQATPCPVDGQEQPDQLPDMRGCGGACWRIMHEIAVRNPRAVLVLLASAMGGMSNRAMGKALQIDPCNLQREKSWLRRHYPRLASTLKK